MAQLLWLESDNPDKPITMYIHSPGGSVVAGLSIYDTMSYIRSPVSTVCLGQAASMGSLLLAGGEKGKRYVRTNPTTPPGLRAPKTTSARARAGRGSREPNGGETADRFPSSPCPPRIQALPHSSIMVHQPLGGTQGQASDILIYANQIQRTREQLNEIFRKHLNQAHGHDKYGLREIEDMMDRDRYLSAHEAKEIGIIDEILTRREDKKKHETPEEGKKKEDPAP